MEDDQSVELLPQHCPHLGHDGGYFVGVEQDDGSERLRHDVGLAFAAAKFNDRVVLVFHGIIKRQLGILKETEEPAWRYDVRQRNNLSICMGMFNRLERNIS